MDALRNWLEQLAPRERLLVIVAALLIGVAVVVIGALRPLLGQAARNDALIADRESLLVELGQVAARLGPQRGSAGISGSSGQSMVLVVDQTTRARGLGMYLKRNQPDGDTSIRLRFEDVPFDLLVEWLAEVQNQHGLATASVNIDAGSETGRVNCNLVLNRSAG